jgi:hypothetical protein
VSAWRGKTLRRKKKLKKKPSFHPFRSGLEKRVAMELVGYAYEPKESIVEYQVPHKYHPDFVHPKNPKIILEIKGYFRSSSEASKYVWVKRDNPDKELIFILSDPYKKAHPSCRPRQNGSVMTIAEWCTKKGFLYYSAHSIPQAIKDGTINFDWVQREKEERGIKC